jgi:ribose 5-phosphate isomerase B
MKIAIASDHAGFSLKEEIKDMVSRELHREVIDFGTDSEERCDFPDFAAKVAHAMQEKQADFGILMCGTGIGMSIAANKFEGIRAAKCNSAVEATLARGHNDANVLCLGGRMLSQEAAFQIVKAFLMSDPEPVERYKLRNQKLEGLESMNLAEMLSRRRPKQQENAAQ